MVVEGHEASQAPADDIFRIAHFVVNGSPLESFAENSFKDELWNNQFRT